LPRIIASLLALCLLSALSLTGAAAADTNPLVGAWALNVAKSQIDSRPLPKSETRTYAVNLEGAVTIVVEGIEADGTAYAYGATGDINGRQYPVVGRDVGARILGDTISWTRIDPTTVEMTIKKKGEVINTTRHSVSADGKTLTVTENGADDEGTAIHATKVYDRQ
jgi:hypothetical protein